ncbi:hypothetical protein ACJ5NV_05345 [Loktanella agnita]|uniref:hypothetical protein n=1 Tax=Loktanella agnita TaxID=287097 RepID=UPI003986C733
MKTPTILAGFAATLLLSACTSPSAQHANHSAHHSAHASAHAVSAVGTGAASVAAVPVTAAGTVLEVSGAALADAGASSVALGNTLYHSGTGEPLYPTVAPNGPPTLR